MKLRSLLARLLLGNDVAELLRGYKPSQGKHNSLITGSPTSWGWGKGDHGSELGGLLDDDHTQYLNTARHDKAARHPLSVLDSAVCSETEADGKITTHKGDASAHHTKYTDANAVSAMGTKAKTNPLRHDYPPEDPAAATKGLRSLGSGAQQAAAGNHTHTLAEDTIGSEKTVWTGNQSGTYCKQTNMDAGTDLDLPAKTLNFAPLSRAVAVVIAHVGLGKSNHVKLRVIMGGTQVAESDYLTLDAQCHILVGTRALSGSQECKGQLHNYYANVVWTWWPTQKTGEQVGAGIGIGSIKI